MSKHSSDSRAGRLLSLGQKVSRIAGSLAETSFGDPPQVPEELLAEAIRARRSRYRHFPDRLFGEPAWDILLELLHADIQERQVTMPNLCESAGVVGTVALRWVNILESEGLVRQKPDPHSAIGKLIELEPAASAALRRYFDELAKAR